MVVTKTPEDSPHAEVAATPDGRVTIPASVRRAAGIEPGQILAVYVENGRVVLEERTHLLTRIQDEAIRAASAAGHTGSAVEDLLAERGTDAAAEDSTVSDASTEDRA